MLGNILATIVRVVNSPTRAMEKLVDADSQRGDDKNLLSGPLEKLAEALEEADEA